MVDLGFVSALNLGQTCREEVKGGPGVVKTPLFLLKEVSNIPLK
jgi:hypothetical protein